MSLESKIEALLFTTDQHRGDHLGIAGMRIVLYSRP